MGSASSRMSASPALVDTPPKRQFIDSAVSEDTSQSERTSVATTATLTTTVKSPSPVPAIIQQSTRESQTVSPPTHSLSSTTSTLPISTDKGKQKEMVVDKEEGEITDDEGAGAEQAPGNLIQPSAFTARRRSSASFNSTDSYRPRPRSFSKTPVHKQGPHKSQHQHQHQPQHRHRPPQQQHQLDSKSKSPKELHFQQHGNQRGAHGQQAVPAHVRSPIQQHRPVVGSGSSVVASSHRPVVPPNRPITNSTRVPPMTPPLPQVTLQSSPPEESLALPKTINDDEAKQYMDIIRNLMHEGIKPDVLIRRGATPKYVRMVCREIVSNSRPGVAQTSSFTEMRDIARETMSPDVKHNIEASIVPPALRSPSPDVPEMTRAPSAASSTSSSEIDIKVERMLSPEQSTSSASNRLVPTSSWQPAPALPTPHVPVESYRPGGIASAPVSAPRPVSQLPTSISSLRPSIPKKAKTLPQPVSSYVPTPPKNPLRERVSDLSPVVKRPPPPPDSQPDVQHASPLTPPPPLPSAPPPPPPASSTVTGPSALDALLESKRRAMASMKRGRKTGSATPTPTPVPDSSTPPIVSRPLTPTLPEFAVSTRVDPPSSAQPPSIALPQASAAIQATLEDEVAALEQEVLGLQNAGPEDMDIDEPEEGEISDVEPVAPPPATPLSLPKIPPIVPSKTPVLLNRATKRPNAEDMMDGRGSIRARSLHPPKRRIFGRAIRPTSLTVLLDDSDDDSDNDDSPALSAAELEMERQRLLKEKEDNINRLREQILRLQARASKDKKAKAKEALAAAALGQKALKDAVVEPEDVVMAEAPSVVDTQSSTIEADQHVVHTTNAVSDAESLEHRIEVDHATPEGQAMTTPQLSSSSTATDTAVIHTPHFSGYRPILDRYPGLADSFAVKTSLAQITPSTPQPHPAVFDAQRLSSIILTRKMQQDPNAVICGAEAAGGSCADSTCSDLHFGKDLQRPDDGSLMEYLSHMTSSKREGREAYLEQLVVKAKGTLGMTGSSAPVSGKSKKKAARSASAGTYDMSAAQQIVTTVCGMIQDDEDKDE